MNGNNIPKWKLEWYLAGSLSPQESVTIAELELSDEELRARIDALRASNAEILAKYRPPVVSWKTNSLSQKLFSGSFMRWTIPALACAALLIVLPLQMQKENVPEEIYATRTKGEIGEEAPGLEVWRKSGDSAEKLSPEAAVKAGDIVQLRYIVPHSCYGALLSMDGRGVLTVHLSGNDDRAAPLTPGRPIALKTSYKLDDAPAFEAFYLITALESFYLDSVKKVLMDVKHPISDEQSLELAQKQVTAFTLRK